MNLNYIKKVLESLYQQKKIHSIASYLNKEQKQKLISYADLLRKDQIYFDADWDMERCTTIYPFDSKEWNTTYHKDEEWCFMKNRMDYLKDLVMASYVSDDTQYMEKGKAWILDWINAHPKIQSEPSTRSLDSGIRMHNIMESIVFLYHENLLNDTELTTMITSLQQHIEYLKQSYIPKYTLSNWGTIQICTILNVLPLWVEHPLEHPIYMWACEELHQQFEIQVYPDGMHWEQSTMYHVEVLLYGLRYIQYQSYYGQSIDDTVYHTVENMMNALYAISTPNRTIDTFGDSDRIKIDEICTLAGIILNSNKWNYHTTESINTNLFFMVGTDAIKNYRKLDEIRESRHYFDGVDSGIFCFRSGWEEDDSFTMITHGSLGSGHGHSDNLHITFYHEGKPVLIDAGRYTYREDEPLRIKLKGVYGHNSIVVDGNTNCLPSDSWSYQDFAYPLKSYIKHQEHIHYFEGTLLGHDPLQAWTRKIISIDPSIWMIVDEVKQDGKHTLQQFFHFDPSCELTKKDTVYQDNCTNMKIHIEGKTTCISEECSLRYNEIQNHQVIVSQQNFEHEIHPIHCFVKQGIQVLEEQVYQEHIPFPKDICSARTFVISPQESYTIVVFHKEIYKGKKICYIHDVPFHAKAIVLHEKNGEKNLIRMKM